MQRTPEEVMQYVKEEDVKFVRMAFCDVYGRRKFYSKFKNNFSIRIH